MEDLVVSRVFVTGHNGYIGSLLTGLLAESGHEVTGCDNYMFAECLFGEDVADIPSLRKDVRDLTRDDLDGFDVVIHLAGISNDPVGDLRPDLTYEVNHQASVSLAKLSAEAGVERFIFSSSCSIYGASAGGWVNEESPTNPVTAYGWSKIKVEDDVRELASDEFSPVFMRNATAYGVSPRLRADLVVNNLVGYAVTQARVLLKSDGTQWRPLIHVEDLARAFVTMLEAPRELVHAQVFNVGASTENYQIRDVAELVQRAVPEALVELAGGASADIRDYRVDCSRIADTVPGFGLRWDVARGAAQLAAAYNDHGVGEEQFLGPLIRLEHIKRMMAQGRLDEDLRVVTD